MPRRAATEQPRGNRSAGRAETLDRRRAAGRRPPRLRAGSGVPVNPANVAAYAAGLDAARAAIGNAAWQAATAVGRSLTPAAMARLAQEPGA